MRTLGVAETRTSSIYSYRVGKTIYTVHLSVLRLRTSLPQILEFIRSTLRRLGQ